MRAGERRSDDPDEVDASMLVKALVFDRDDGTPQMRRDARERNFDPLLFEDREDRLLRRIEDRCRLGHIPDRGERVTTGQARGDVVAKPRDAAGESPCGGGERDKRREREVRAVLEQHPARETQDSIL